jgi:hypothetical protein
MARIRSIKPEFFDDEELCALSSWHRLCFVGLWLEADRDGRLEDRPKRLKPHIFPYDDLDIDALLTTLAESGFILRYTVDGRSYIQIVNFARHQLPSRDEPPSEIPMPTGELGDQSRMPNATVRARIYARDRYRCVYCERDMSHDARARSVDHVIPYGQGGSHHDSNLATCCKPCNQKKQNRDPAGAGLRWPDGLGLLKGCQAVNTPLTGGQHTVNGPLTPRQHPPDTNGNGNGNGNGEGESVSKKVGGVEDAADAAAPPTKTRAGDLADLWNATTTPPIPRCRELTEDRKRRIRSRLSERDFTEWGEVFAKIEQSAFMRGENRDGWRVSFDWIIRNSEHAARVLEGKYDNRTPTKPEPQRFEDFDCQHEPRCTSARIHANAVTMGR